MVLIASGVLMVVKHVTMGERFLGSLNWEESFGGAGGG